MRTITSLIFNPCILTLLLIGCGGGTDSGGSTGKGGGGGNSGMTYVAGEFKTADNTGQYLPNDNEAFGNGGGECVISYNYNYFESANVLVYGDPSLPNSDFQYAATLVENKLNEAFNLMGITRAKFDSYRPQYSPQVANDVTVSYLEEHYIQTDNGNERQDITDVDSDFVAPSGWDAMNYNNRLNIIKGYWNNISDSKQTEFVIAFGELYNFDAIDGRYIPEKITVCLDQTKDSVIYGQGSLLGMNIAPDSKASRSDAEQVVLHELIHTIQINISLPVNAAVYVNDQWFMEGQATNLAGQKTASNHDDHYPVNVVTYEDEQGYFADSGVAYEHYSKAYSYLEAHSGTDAVLNMLTDTRLYQGNGTYEAFASQSSDRFRAAFDANILKANGEKLTLQDWRNNYSSLMSN